MRDLAADVLRHRLVLSYDALSDGVSADQLVEQVIAAVEPMDHDAAPPEALPLAPPVPEERIA